MREKAFAFTEIPLRVSNFQDYVKMTGQLTGIDPKS